MSAGYNYTEWYPGEIKPVREGAYEVEFSIFTPAYAWFRVDTVDWACPRRSIDDAEDSKHVRASNQARKWRGLKEEVKPDDGAQRPIDPYQQLGYL